MQKYTFGLTEILVADVLTTGKMPEIATMKKIGEVHEGTASINNEAGDKTEFREEGVSAPKKVILKASTFGWVFNIMNVSVDMLAEFVGGKKVLEEWAYYGNAKVVEKALFVKPKEGLYWKIPKAAISALIVGEYNDDGPITLNFEVSLLDPGNNEPSLMAGEVSKLPPEG